MKGNKMTILTATDARNDFLNIIDRASDNLEEFIITKKGDVKAVIMSAREFESWKETIEILSDKRAIEDIRQSEADYKAGRVTKLEDYKKKCMK